MMRIGSRFARVEPRRIARAHDDVIDAGEHGAVTGARDRELDLAQIVDSDRPGAMRRPSRRPTSCWPAASSKRSRCPEHACM